MKSVVLYGSLPEASASVSTSLAVQLSKPFTSRQESSVMCKLGKVSFTFIISVPLLRSCFQMNACSLVGHSSILRTAQKDSGRR
jgi:hypothetical protein